MLKMEIENSENFFLKEGRNVRGQSKRVRVRSILRK